MGLTTFDDNSVHIAFIAVLQPVPNLVSDLPDLPDELRTTLRGRRVDAGDPNFQQASVHYTGQHGQHSTIFITPFSVLLFGE